MRSAFHSERRVFRLQDEEEEDEEPMVGEDDEAAANARLDMMQQV